jgi:nucleotide-binding universal stress UspA family protein
VTLLHVHEITIFHPLNGALGYGTSSSESVREALIEHRRKELDAFAGEDLTGLNVKREVRCGDIARIIVEYAQAESADLIVMPTHGVGPVRRLLLGSITAKVLHDSDRPVWTSRPISESVHDASHVRHVMCAVNFRCNDAHIVRWAAGFAAEFGAKLTLVHAILTAPAEMPERYAFTWHDEARMGADERLHSLSRELGVCAELLVVTGDTPIALGLTAKEKGADVLVIGRSHATNMIGRLGSRTYGIICHARCPVVTL